MELYPKSWTEGVDCFQDDGGCPEFDNDQNGIPDAKDKCPDKAEIENGYEDQDGCPDKEPKQTLKIQKYNPVILEGVHFEFDSARLMANSEIILDLVVETLENHPDMFVRITGHTDNIGSDSYNQWLSKRRAESVKGYLSTHGIDSSRVETRGVGEEQPIVDNSTPEGRERNRRIEIVRITPGDLSAGHQTVEYHD